MDPKRQGIEADESVGIPRIIVAFICFHRGNILIIEAIIRFPSCDHTVSAIELQANGSADPFLSAASHLKQDFHFR